MMRKIFQKKNYRYVAFVLICTLWSGIFFILPDFIDNPFQGIKGFIILSLHWGLISAATFLLLYIMGINKYIFSLLFPIFSLLGSILAFYRYAFKTSLTPMLIDAALNNDKGTTMDLLSAPLILYVLFSLGISILFVYFRIRKIKLSKPTFHLIIPLILLCLFFTVNKRVSDSVFQRFPFNICYNVYLYNHLKIEQNVVRINPDHTLRYKPVDSLYAVVVIGESLRADHLQLNGYERATNPLLSKRSDLFSQPYIFSEYTNTNRSLPHLLTRADSINPLLAFKEKSFVTLFKQSNYSTYWISNQDPADTYISFIKECDTTTYVHPEKSVYNYNIWLDEDLLPPIKKELLKHKKNQLFILHTIGSHWYYNNHFSKKYAVFRPITSSRILVQCSKQELINSYDNTVIYTDFFLNELIKLFEDKNAFLIYLSDHGEVLGENGMWLHAGDNIASKNPASFIWMSKKYMEKNPFKVQALQKNTTKHYRTDYLYPTVLDGADIPTNTIDKSLSLFENNN